MTTDKLGNCQLNKGRHLSVTVSSFNFVDKPQLKEDMTSYEYSRRLI